MAMTLSKSEADALDRLDENWIKDTYKLFEEKNIYP